MMSPHVREIWRETLRFRELVHGGNGRQLVSVGADVHACCLDDDEAHARYLDDGGLCFGLVEAAVLFLEVERYRPSFHVGVLLS